MEIKLSHFFQLVDMPSENEEFFYNVIKDKTNSVECHKALVELFAQALQLNSYKYRKADVPYHKTKYIKDEEILNKVLTYLSSDLKEPLVQVMFEQFHMADAVGAGNNSTVLKTFKGNKEKDSLQKSVDTFRSIEYATRFNNMREIYERKFWGSKSNFPTAIENLNLADPPTIETVKNKFNELRTWIENNNPKLDYLNKQKEEKDVKKNIQSFFHRLFPWFRRGLIAKILLDKICAKTDKHKSMYFRDTFLEILQTEISENLSHMSYNDEMESLAQQICAVPKEQLSNEYLELYKKACQMFNIGLALSSKNIRIYSTTSDIIYNTCNKFIETKNDNNLYVDFLKDQINLTIQTLLENEKQDYNILSKWSKELNEPISGFIDEEHIYDLMTIACNVLSSISLKPKQDFDGNKITDIRLFAFSDFSVISQYCGGKGEKLVHYPYRKKEGAKSDKIVVSPDASEKDYGVNDSKPFYRPTYAIISYYHDNDKKTALKFFNVGENPSKGEFFFIDVGEPARVITQQRDSERNRLEFNFRSVTINDSNVVTEGIHKTCKKFSVNQPYKTIDNGSSSSKVFYQVVKQVSKWTKLNGQRSYDVLYETTVVNKLRPSAHLIWRLPSGSGLARAEKVDDSLVLWEWHDDERDDCTFSRVGEFLGLPLSRQIVRRAYDYCTVGKVDYRVLGEWKQNIQDISYKFIKIQVKNDPNAASELYVLTNTPHNQNLSFAIITPFFRNEKKSQSKKISQKSVEILRVLNFSYYRKVDTTHAANPKVIKWIPKTGSPQRPVVGDGITIDETPDDYTVIGIDLPISFRLCENFWEFKKLTGARKPMHPSIKNKESPLYRSKGARSDAGRVMNKLKDFLKSPPKTKYTLPATVFGNWAVENSSEVLKSWQDLKDTTRSSLPTNQEWCHIKGHGDGGDERLGNFVGGSFHCNTEQLAIESGQRITTQSSYEGKFKLYSTAYLFKNEDGVMKQADYLDNDNAYKTMKEVHTKLKRKTDQPLPKYTGAGTNIPFAAFFRYKVERNPPGDGNEREKVFEHIFEGQSEFMDVHQFSILSKTTEFVVAGMEAFKKWYNEQQEVYNQAAAEDTKMQEETTE